MASYNISPNEVVPLEVAYAVLALEEEKEEGEWFLKQRKEMQAW